MENIKNNKSSSLSSSSEIPPNYGSIEENFVDQQLWMAHIPSKLGSVWKDAPEGTILGTLTFTKGGGQRNKHKQHTKFNPRGDINSNRSNSNCNSNQRVNSKHSLTIDIAPEHANQHPDLPPKYTIENISKKINGALHPFTRHDTNSSKGTGTGTGLGTATATATATGAGSGTGTTTSTGNQKHDLNNNNSSHNNHNHNHNHNHININANDMNKSNNENKKALSTSASTITIHGSVTTSCHFQIARQTSKISSSSSSLLSSSIINDQGQQQYRNLCKKRLMETNNQKRVVQPVDSSELSLRRATAAAVLSAGQGFGNAVQQHGKSIIEARENSLIGGNRKRKIEIAEGQSVRSVIFELFSSRRFWSVRELKGASGLMEKEIKPVLSEICMFHKKGDHRNLWELKSEYQMMQGDGNSDDNKGSA